jgi:hypothetical protein
MPPECSGMGSAILFVRQHDWSERHEFLRRQGPDRFLYTVSGAASFAGLLLFVGLSINLARIISTPAIPDRSGETLIFLGSVLVSALLGLVSQPSSAFGFELLCVGCFVWCAATYFYARALRLRLYDTVSHGFQRVAYSQAATLPLVIGAVSFLLHGWGGLYWLVPGLILLLIASMINAWVLLVEILR